MINSGKKNIKQETKTQGILAEGPPGLAWQPKPKNQQQKTTKKQESGVNTKIKVKIIKVN